MSTNGGAERLAATGNGRAIARSAVPELSPSELFDAVVAATGAGLRVVAFFGMAEPGSDAVGLSSCSRTTAGAPPPGAGPALQGSGFER